MSDLEELTLRFVADVPGRGSEGMTLATGPEAARFVAAVLAVADGQADRAAELLDPLSYSVSPVTDTVTGRAPWIVHESREEAGSWPHGRGLYVLAAEPAGGRDAPLRQRRRVR